ncbi:MAG: DnaJ C-terminal domain-containing protein [Candidatus Daviesbacteria bacterium]|nr:DnaJ C-terminal domain-containing protein [Candidatus Daviesbacteria bacterium]
MATKRDFYEVLGLKKNASEAEIKSAYRKLARAHHPDVDKTAGAEARFKEISEAYQVLSDPQKKSTYDQFGSAAFEPGAGGGPGGFGGGAQGNPFGGFYYDFSSGNRSSQGQDFGGFEDPFSLFEQIFGMGNMGGFSGRAQRQNPTYQLEIDFEDAVNGGTKHVQIPAENGHKRELTIKIPPGVDNGTRMRFEDVDIIFRLRRHPDFLREGSDIFSDILLNIPQLVLGDVVEVKTVWGKVKLKVPAGTEPGALIRIKGQGMPNLRGSGRGDHFVRVKLEVPKKLTTEEKDLYEKLLKLKPKKNWF